MESSALDRLTRLFANAIGRRAALAGGMAALTAQVVAAQPNSQNGNVAGGGSDSCPRRCPPGPPGPRGRRGPAGPRGKPGPRAGAGIQVINRSCTVNHSDDAVIACPANCPAGMVASGGGFNIGDSCENLATVRHSEPIMSGARPVGWSVSIEFFDTGQDFDFSAYAICIPG